MTEQEKREMAIEEYEMMAQTCENYHSCGVCPYNPEDLTRFIGERWKGGCPDFDRKLVYALGKGYRKEEEVLREERNKIYQMAKRHYEHGDLRTFMNAFRAIFGVEVEE